jgi:predicted dehydrogenase
LISRVLIVGSGSIGLRHLQILRDLLPSATIKFLRHATTSTEIPSSDGHYVSLEDALKFNPEIAVIANPAPYHLDIAKALFEAGANVLVEKPLAESNDGVSELIDLVGSRKNILTVGYNLRYSPSLVKFRELLTENKIGKVVSVRCEAGQFLPSWRPNTRYQETVSAKSNLGGGVLLELSHEIDYLMWIFGQIDWVRATLSKQSDLEIDVEDTAHLVLGFVSDNFKSQNIGTLNLDFVRHDMKRECTAIGETGSLHWNGIMGTVEYTNSGALEPATLYSHVPNRNETYLAEWRNFLACIENGQPARVTVQEASNVLDVIAAIRKSAKTGIQTSVENSSSTDRVM